MDLAYSAIGKLHISGDNAFHKFDYESFPDYFQWQYGADGSNFTVKDFRKPDLFFYKNDEWWKSERWMKIFYELYSEYVEFKIYSAHPIYELREHIDEKDSKPYSAPVYLNEHVEIHLFRTLKKNNTKLWFYNCLLNGKEGVYYYPTLFRSGHHSDGVLYHLAHIKPNKKVK